MLKSRISSRSIEPFEEPGINLTPLIDVVFVILIMFIVIAPLLELDRIELAEGSQAPGSSSVSVQESSPVTIHVRDDNTVWLNGNRVVLSDLPTLLKETKARYPAVRPQIFHDRKAYFGTYQAVKNAAEEAGYSHIDIILKPT